MSVYYVGIGGDNANNGTTWALRKLTLTGAEDLPVAADDTVYVGPGTYKELLTVDVSGGAGTPIVYIGDCTGEHTDGVGGKVRLTGADAGDTGESRNNVITANDKDYRTFRGFAFDTAALEIINTDTGCTNWIIEDCSFQHGHAGVAAISVDGLAQASWTIQRCVFFGAQGYYIQFTHSAQVANAGHVLYNNIFTAGHDICVRIDRVGGITVRNCTFHGDEHGIFIATTLGAGYTAVTVNNCLFSYMNNRAVSATAVGELVENYNNFYANATDRTNVNVGAQSTAYIIMEDPPFLHSGTSQVSGYRFDWVYLMLAPWSGLRAITGSGEQSIDVFGIARPATAAKNSWGATQYQGQIRSSTQAQAGTYSLKFPDAGRVQFKIPTTDSEITVSVYCYREANYAGTNPQMIIKQPGVADRTTTDAGAAAGWNQLTDTFTPAASPGYIFVELASGNSAAAGNYACYFDTGAVG